VIVQDGYVDRTVSFGMAGGPYLAAALALRWPRLFLPFDVAVYLHAPTEVRRVRLAGRTDADPVDIRGVEDPAFADRFSATLVHGMGRRHRNLLVFDTSLHTPEEMAARVADLALGPAPRTGVVAVSGHRKAA
jgi:dTMP kinase